MNDLVRHDATALVVPNVWLDTSVFDQVQRAASLLAASDMVPTAYKGNVPNCVLALEIAQRLNMSPLMVVQNLDVIHGRPGWRARAKIAMFSSSGRFETIRYELSEEAAPAEFSYTAYVWQNVGGKNKKVPETRTITERDQRCRAWTRERGHTEKLFGPWVSIRMAIEEGWYDHDGSKWKTALRELMLRYRAAAFLIDTTDPGVSLGLPMAEDLIDSGPEVRAVAAVVVPPDPPRGGVRDRVIQAAPVAPDEPETPERPETVARQVTVEEAGEEPGKAPNPPTETDRAATVAPEPPAQGGRKQKTTLQKVADWRKALQEASTDDEIQGIGLRISSLFVDSSMTAQLKKAVEKRLEDKAAAP